MVAQTSIDQERPQPAHRPATDTPFRALLHVSGLVKRAMQPFFAGFGISGSQWGVLRVLHRAEGEGLEGLRLTDLGDRLLVRPPSVTAVVGRLQQLGMVDRETSREDQRARQVSLTAAGRQLVERVLSDHARRVQEVLGGLSEPEQKQLHALLDKLGAHVSGMEMP